MDLRHLTHLLALADTCHFARAAERVHLSQPAFSRSIQALERQVGMRLFERDSGDIRPTPAGLFLISRARQVLFDVRCVQRDVALYRDTQLGDTAFGVGPFPAATMAQQVLAELRRDHPQVGLRAEVSNWDLLQERLRQEDIEFFVADIRDVPGDLALDIQPLGRQSGHFYVRTGHPLQDRPYALRDVWGYGVVATRIPAGIQKLLAGMLDPRGGQPLTLALECDDVHILRAVTLSTDSLWASTDAAVRGGVQSGALRLLRISDLPETHVEMGVVSLRKRTPSPMAQRAIDCFKRVALQTNSGMD